MEGLILRSFLPGGKPPSVGGVPHKEKAEPYNSTFSNPVVFRTDTGHTRPIYHILYLLGRNPFNKAYRRCLGTSDRNPEAKKPRRGLRLSDDSGPIRESDLAKRKLVPVAYATDQGKAAAVEESMGKSLLNRRETLIVRLSKIEFPESNSEKFRKSLVEQWSRFGKLSIKQWHYVKKLIKQHRRTMRVSKAPKAVYRVYVMQAGGKIKIGYSANPMNRLKEIQTSNANSVKLLKTKVCVNCPAAKALEKKLHKKFRHYRLRGEWFSSEILDEIYKLAW